MRTLLVNTTNQFLVPTYPSRKLDCCNRPYRNTVMIKSMYVYLTARQPEDSPKPTLFPISNHSHSTALSHELRSTTASLHFHS